MTFTLAHSASTLRIKFSSSLNQGDIDESFGLSDLKIFYCDKHHGDCFTSNNNLPLPG